MEKVLGSKYFRRHFISKGNLPHPEKLFSWGSSVTSSQCSQQEEQNQHPLWEGAVLDSVLWPVKTLNESNKVAAEVLCHTTQTPDKQSHWEHYAMNSLAASSRQIYLVKKKSGRDFESVISFMKMQHHVLWCQSSDITPMLSRQGNWHQAWHGIDREPLLKHTRLLLYVCRGEVNCIHLQVSFTSVRRQVWLWQLRYKTLTQC